METSGVGVKPILSFLVQVEEVGEEDAEERYPEAITYVGESTGHFENFVEAIGNYSEEEGIQLELPRYGEGWGVGAFLV